MEVDNIIIEDTNGSQKFVIYGTIHKKGTKTIGGVISIDFSELH